MPNSELKAKEMRELSFLHTLIPKPWFLVLLLLVVGLIHTLVVYTSWYLFPTWMPIDHLEDRYGYFNSLFTGLAFAGIIYTLWLQHWQLQIQRDQSEKQLHEIQSQQRQLQVQAFEATFFQILQLQDAIRASLICVLPEASPNGFSITNVRQTGRLVFDLVLRGIESRYEQERASLSNEKALLDWVTKVHTEECLQSNPFLGHYFRSLYHIFKYVDESELPNKKRYTSLVRAQLSDAELELLLINCLTDIGRVRFKGLAEKYALFQHMPKQGLLDRLVSFYNQSAFGS